MTDFELKQHVSELQAIADKAMTSAWIRHCMPDLVVRTDYSRGIREKYQGTVYEYPEEVPVLSQRHIDPHRWANMRQYVYGHISTVVRYNHLPRIQTSFARIIEETPGNLRSSTETEIKIVIAGLRAAADSYRLFTPSSPVGHACA